jgi:hypothetical protein
MGNAIAMILQMTCLPKVMCGVVFAVCLIGPRSEPARADDGEGTVQVQMRNIALHVDERTIMNVRRLRGELVSTKAGEPPVFDDKNSFTVKIDSAEIAISVDSLSQLMNGYVFNYSGAPLEHLQVTTEGRNLRIKGTLKKGVAVPFNIVATARVDEQGALRLHPVSIKTLGIPSKGLLDFIGLDLQKLIKVNESRGVRIDGDDFVMRPNGLLPPPRIDGRLQSVRIEPNTVVQVFGPGTEKPLTPPDPKTNYMYYRGGVLRFGKLTMTDTDMELIDQRPQDPFDFFQDRYIEQLVAGYSKNTKARGLKVYMPDYRTLHRR